MPIEVKINYYDNVYALV